jgi:hypothetical protein
MAPNWHQSGPIVGTLYRTLAMDIHDMIGTITGGKFSEIIYLHKVSNFQFTHMAEDIDIWSRLPGFNGHKNVVFARVYGYVPFDEPGAQGRLFKYLKNLVAQGLTMTEFTGTSESGWAIVSLIVDGPRIPAAETELDQRKKPDPQKKPSSRMSQLYELTCGGHGKFFSAMYSISLLTCLSFRSRTRLSICQQFSSTRRYVYK